MKKARKSLFISVVALILCFSMLLGTTWAWFTDDVSSVGNKIQSGTLKVDLELLDKKTNKWNSLKETSEPIFDYDKWEPGYTVENILKIENEGSLALKWAAKFASETALSILADVIDVYVKPSDTELAYSDTRSLDGYTYAGTVAEFVNTIEETTNGTLEAGEVAYLGIILKMRENAGNEHQGLSLGGAFDIRIVATQWTGEFENDSFDNQYDKEATYPSVVTDLSVSVNVAGKITDGKLTENVVVSDRASGINAIIPAGTAVTSETLTMSIKEDVVDRNVTLDTTIGYDVVVEGVAEDNTGVIIITIPGALPAGMTAVQFFHDGVTMVREFNLDDVGADDFIYDKNTGDVTFGLTHFSNISAGSSTSVYVNGVKYDGIEILLNDYVNMPVDEYIEGNYNLVIPNDGNTYILTFDSGDRAKRNPLSFSGTWHSSYNLNPGDSTDETKQYYPYGIIVEDGATVILNNVSIRVDLDLANENRVTDAIRIGYELSELNYMNEHGISYFRGNNTKTRILVADGSYNCLVGKSGVGFGYYTGANVFFEGQGALYTAAIRAAYPAIGTGEKTDGGATTYAESGPKLTFNVGWMVAVPMKGAAGIGSGFPGSAWSGVNTITINGGAMQVYAGADATAIGSGKCGNVNEIVINGGKVYLYCPPALTVGNTMGSGPYAGSCRGIYISKDAYVYYGTAMSWDKCIADNKVNGFDPMLGLEIIDNNNGVYSKNDTLNLTVKVNRKYGGSEEVTEYTVSGVDMSAPGVQKGTITYKENGNTRTANISDIRIIAPVNLTVEPKRTLYNVGEVNKADFKVIVYDSTGVATTLSDFDITVDGNINASGHVNVTVAKDGLSATCSILMWNMTKLEGNNMHTMYYHVPVLFNVSGWSNHTLGNTYVNLVGKTHTIPGTGEVVSGLSYANNIKWNSSSPTNYVYTRGTDGNLTVKNASRYTTLGVEYWLGYDAVVSAVGYYFDGDMSTLQFTEPARDILPTNDYYQFLGQNGFRTNYLTCDLYSFKPGTTHTVNWVAIFPDGIQTFAEWTVTMKAETANDDAYEIDPTKPNVNVIILAGQSNATGSAPITADIRAQYGNKEFSNVFINYINQETVGNTVVTHSTNGNNFDMYKLGIGGLDANHFGPELGLADYLSTNASGETWYIIKYAPAGSELDRQWFGDLNLADRMIGYVQDKINILAKDYNVKVAGFVWMQGESDALNYAPGVADRYSSNEQKLMKMVRDEFAAYATRNSTALNTPGSGIVFVNGGIATSGVWPYHTTVNNAKKANCAWLFDPVSGGFTNPGGNIANSIFVDTSTLISKNQSFVAGLDDYGNAQDNNDQAHYCDESMLSLGTWFGTALRSMMINCP